MSKGLFSQYNISLATLIILVAFIAAVAYGLMYVKSELLPQLIEQLNTFGRKILSFVDSNLNISLVSNDEDENLLNAFQSAL